MQCLNNLVNGSATTTSEFSTQSTYTVQISSQYSSSPSFASSALSTITNYVSANQPTGSNFASKQIETISSKCIKLQNKINNSHKNFSSLVW